MFIGLVYIHWIIKVCDDEAGRRANLTAPVLSSDGPYSTHFHDAYAPRRAAQRPIIQTHFYTAASSWVQGIFSWDVQSMESPLEDVIVATWPAQGRMNVQLSMKLTLDERPSTTSRQ